MASSTTSSPATPTAGEKVSSAPGSPDVYISEEAMKAISHVPIRAHVRVRGIQRTHPRVIARDLESIKRSGTIEDVARRMEDIKERWAQMGIFNSVQYNLEPTEGGGPNDVCVHIDVTEANAKKSVGVFTTDTVIPEVGIAFENAFGGRYTIKGNYIPPTSRTHAVSLSLFSNVPWIGQRAEYSLGVRNESRNCQPASTERVEEVKVTTSNSKVGFFSDLTVGYRRRTMVGKETRHLPQDLLTDFAQRGDGYVRHDMRISNVGYHGDPYLYNIYPLPIVGKDVAVTSEFAGGILGGINSFFKTEMQCTQYWPVGPFCSFQCSWRLGGIYSFFNKRTPLNDRLFLSSCHVRGYKAVGPSTLDFPEGRGGRFASIGGNALWATSASFNFPVPFFPNNGLASMHVFANAGNLKYVETTKQLLDVKSWISSCVGSIGAGVVVTRIPLFGTAPTGRFELNFSIPVRLTDGGSLSFSAPNCNLFDKFKFGLVWSSALTI